MTWESAELLRGGSGQETGPLPAQSCRMRTDVPPPGKAMTFPEWSAAIVAGVRAFLPDVRAARKGARVVIIRHGDREARLEAGGSFWITFPAGEMKTTMASLVDDRRDSYTQRDHINIYGDTGGGAFRAFAYC
jgi:hypothetical protein